MNNEKALEALKSVLCNPEGKCCIDGSDEDRRIIDEALNALKEPDYVDIVKEKITSWTDVENHGYDFTDGWNNSIINLQSKGYLRTPLKSIDGLAEALEFRKEVNGVAIKNRDNFYGMNKDKPPCHDITIYEAATKYLGLTK